MAVRATSRESSDTCECSLADASNMRLHAALCLFTLCLPPDERSSLTAENPVTESTVHHPSAVRTKTTEGSIEGRDILFT